MSFTWFIGLYPEILVWKLFKRNKTAMSTVKRKLIDELEACSSKNTKKSKTASNRAIAVEGRSRQPLQNVANAT